MAESFYSRYSGAWSKMGMGTREKPTEVFPTFTKKEFDTLKNDYVKQYGYTIRIPQWDDVVHWEPKQLKTEKQLKDEKKENLIRVLESPAPEWGRNYATAMTLIDNIQDTSSILIPLASLLFRMAPKFMGKFLSGFGWISLGYDLLNLANAIGRAPLTMGKSKRSVCKFLKQNPFSLKARIERTTNIRNWKPNIADFIQAAQVSDQFTGVGLSLGGIMGAITSTIFGGYRYLTGEPVRFSWDPPEVSNLANLGARGLQAANAISTQDQTFSEEVHFYTYITAALSNMALAGEFKDAFLGDLIEDPQNMALPAPEPTDPLTVAVIQEQGLRVQDGVGWPWNGKKIISGGDYIDATAEPSRSNFVSYSMRHNKDWYGWLAAGAMQHVITHTFEALDPDSALILDDTSEMKVFWKMIKAPLLPTGPLDQEKYTKFMSWANDFTELYGKEPRIMEIEEKFKLMGIPFTRSYPLTPQPGFEDFWPEGWTADEAF